VAAKTGTSEAYHDNWAIGYTRAVTVGVWVGNFDRRPLIGSSGVAGAGPVFHAVMLAAARRATGTTTGSDELATAARPERTVRRTICALSGMAAAPWCPAATEEWIAADVPAPACSWHRRTASGIVVDYPAEYHAWAASQRRLFASVAPSAPTPAPGERLDGLPPPPPTVLRVLNPPDGAVYLIDPTLRREFQTIGLRVAAGDEARIEWRVDGSIVGSATAGKAIDWALAVGRHVVSANDGHGHRAEVAFDVK
jgi:penicillin-binding protein 1C